IPGYRNKSQVPPIEPRASRMAKVLPGHLSCTWYPAPIPDRPAPTISTSTCSRDIRDHHYGRTVACSVVRLPAEQPRLQLLLGTRTKGASIHAQGTFSARPETKYARSGDVHVA